jgi:preprotein translocase subunit YajC
MSEAKEPRRGDNVVLADGRVGVVVSVDDKEHRPGTLLIQLTDGETVTASPGDIGMGGGDRRGPESR